MWHCFEKYWHRCLVRSFFEVIDHSGKFSQLIAVTCHVRLICSHYLSSGTVVLMSFVSRRRGKYASRLRRELSAFLFQLEIDRTEERKHFSLRVPLDNKCLQPISSGEECSWRVAGASFFANEIWSAVPRRTNRQQKTVEFFSFLRRHDRLRRAKARPRCFRMRRKAIVCLSLLLLLLAVASLSTSSWRVWFLQSRTRRRRASDGEKEHALPSCRVFLDFAHR